jgi:hypothetical protein
MLQSLRELAGALDGARRDRVREAITARRTELAKRRARRVRAFAQFLPASR